MAAVSYKWDAVWIFPTFGQNCTEMCSIAIEISQGKFPTGEKTEVYDYDFTLSASD